MRYVAGLLVIGTALLSGCGGNNPSAVDPNVQKATVAPTAKTADGMDDIVAKVSGEPITMRELVEPLIESRGLTMLINLIELDLARQNAVGRYHLTVTEKDFADERERTLEKLFKESDDTKLTDTLDKAIAAKDTAAEAKIRAEIKLEHDDYLMQVLINQHIDPVEFNIVLKINTYLRKVLELEWKNKITEDAVKAAFGQMFGARVRVEYIYLQNMNEVVKAQRRIQSGDPFEKVARDMSHDPKTAELGGALPPFSREAHLDKAFIDASFNLRDGQVSDVVVVGPVYMLIKRIEELAPQAVKFDKTMHDRMYDKLWNSLMETGVKQMKKQLGAQAVAEMTIINPTLKKQYDEGKDRQAKAEQKAQDELDRQQHERDGLRLTPGTQPAGTQPATGPALAPGATTEPAPPAAGEQPPATEPGSVIHTFTLPPIGPDTKPAVAPELNK